MLILGAEANPKADRDATKSGKIGGFREVRPPLGGLIASLGLPASADDFNVKLEDVNKRKHNRSAFCPPG